MTVFPLPFLKTLVFASLTLCVIGAASLLIMLFLDYKKRRMW